MRKFVPASTAAKVLGVRPDTLRAWAKAGKIPHYTSPGGRYYYALNEDVAPVEKQPETSESIAEPTPEPRLLPTDVVDPGPVLTSAELGRPAPDRAWWIEVGPGTVFRVIAGLVLSLLILFALTWPDRSPERPAPVETVETRLETGEPATTRRVAVVKRPPPRQAAKPCGFWSEHYQ